MPTIIKIKTYVCPHCKSNRDSDPNDQELMAKIHPGLPKGQCWACYFGILYDPKRPHENVEFKAHSGCMMVRETNTEKLCEITIMDEAHFDNSDLIEHNGNFIFKQQADELDGHDLTAHLEKINKTKAVEALAKGDIHNFKPLTEKDNHGWVAPTRRELPQDEREKWKAKIRADIIKFKALEHK